MMSVSDVLLLKNKRGLRTNLKQFKVLIPSVQGNVSNRSRRITLLNQSYAKGVDYFLRSTSEQFMLTF